MSTAPRNRRRQRLRLRGELRVHVRQRHEAIRQIQHVPCRAEAQLPKRPVSHVQSFLQPQQRLLCLPDGTENGICPTGKTLYGRWLPTDSQHL